MGGVPSFCCILGYLVRVVSGVCRNTRVNSGVSLKGLVYSFFLDGVCYPFHSESGVGFILRLLWVVAGNVW